jgi:hypothetical protein
MPMYLLLFPSDLPHRERAAAIQVLTETQLKKARELNYGQGPAGPMHLSSNVLT